ncbi:MAG: acetate--CoA ligase [Candidatus Bathyarchaeota archaeon]
MGINTENGKEVIQKTFKGNMGNYEEAYSTFNLENVKKEFNWASSGNVNIAYEAIDKHVETWRKNKVALYCIRTDGRNEKFTFQEMKLLSNKFANVLMKLNVKKGDRIFIFLERIPELFISAMGIAKVGAVIGPLFSAFMAEAVMDRLQDSGARFLITTPNLKKRVDEVRKGLPSLEHIILVNATENELKQGEVSYEVEMAKASDKFEVKKMSLEDPVMMHYTSGTTGKPKGVVHVHGYMIGSYITAKWVLDLREDDIYWCTADPGWVTGTSYGIWGPWLNGVSQVVLETRFDPDKWYSIIDENKVTVWYTAPTALRMLMRAGDEVIKKYDLSSLRHICSVGEPLNPEVIHWGMKVYGLPIYDTWWQTETGSMMITNYPCLPIKPGSMGKPFPGITAAAITEKGEILPPGETGLLAIKPPWSSIMRTIWKNEKKYKEYFKVPGWYLSGDNAYVDKDGYFWFIGRADDVIKTAGHRVGPFEVESALIEHPAVAEAGVIGKPDPERGEIIKAFISLRKGYEPSTELKQDITQYVKRHLAAHAYPKEIEFYGTLPKTRSGKIMRRVLKAKELGLPTGDLSTMED